MAKIPKKEKSDINYSLKKAGIAAIPYIGGSAAEIFSLIISPPIERRRDAFLNIVVERLQSIESRIENFNIRTLAEDDRFITVFLNTFQIAMRNHQKEKLDALQNVILNTAVSHKIDEDIIQMFLRNVDDFTSLHIRLLMMLDDPKLFAKNNSIELPNWSQGGVGSVIETVLPEFRNKRNIYDLLGNDLLSRGLIISANFHNTITVDSMLRSHTTDLGKEFIRYIISPKI